MNYHTTDAESALHELKLCSCYRYPARHFRPNPPIERVQEVLARFGFVLVESTQTEGPLHTYHTPGFYHGHDPARCLWSPHPYPTDDLNGVILSSYACHQLAGPLTYAEAASVLGELGFKLSQTTWGSIRVLVWKLEHPESGFCNGDTFSRLKDVVALAHSHLNWLAYQPARQRRLVDLIEQTTPKPAPARSARSRSETAPQDALDADVRRAVCRRITRAAPDPAITQLPLFDDDQ